jgi:hypothetical protein
VALERLEAVALDLIAMNLAEVVPEHIVVVVVASLRDSNTVDIRQDRSSQWVIAPALRTFGQTISSNTAER